MDQNNNKIEVSIVSPMHNEELSAEEYVRRTHAALIKMNTTFEIIVVNDGSTDKTESILRDLQPKYPGLRIVCLSRNAGQWAATYAGMQQSRGQYVVVMDSDLQHLPEEIHLLVEKNREGYDMVSGARKNRKESFFLRRIPSLIANYMIRKITGCPTKDMGGYKCIQGDIARDLHLKAGQHRLLPALVWQRGGQVAEVPISAPPRFAGESHYGIMRAFDVLFDIILFWLQQSFKARQIYLFGRISLFIFLMSMGMLGVVFYDKFAHGIHLANRPPFFLGLSGLAFAFGTLAFGFVLEVVSNIQNQVEHAKPYRIKTIIE